MRRYCRKCGGSVLGKEFNTYCEHEFVEPPEPVIQQVMAATETNPGRPCEQVWEARITQGRTAHIVTHPLRDEAIALAKKWWWEQLITKMAKNEMLADAYGAEEVGGWTSGRVAEGLVAEAVKQKKAGRAEALKKFAEKQRTRLADVPESHRILGRPGMGLKHKQNGTCVVLISMAHRGERAVWWNTDAHPVHESQVQTLYNEMTYDDWYRLASSMDAGDRKRVADALKLRGLTSAEYMPMGAVQRATYLAEGCYAVTPVCEEPEMKVMAGKKKW
jgi:hypothetical protein